MLHYGTKSSKEYGPFCTGVSTQRGRRC
jgi:hypothetical protein